MNLVYRFNVFTSKLDLVNDESGSAVVDSFDLSSQCDGVNKIFSLPSEVDSVLSLSYSSFPYIFEPTTDYVLTDPQTITLTSGTPAPLAGQTLIVVVKLTTGSSIDQVDLSSQCNGATSTFTLPNPINRVLLLSYSSSPYVFRPLVDFIIIDPTHIQLSGSVPPPGSGQTLIALVA